MGMRHLALVCLLALPVIAGAPKGKPPVKKVVYTVDQLIEMSGIATFTASDSAAPRARRKPWTPFFI